MNKKSNLVMPMDLYDSEPPTLSEKEPEYTGERTGVHRDYDKLLAVSVYELLRGMKSVTKNQAEFMRAFEERRGSPGHW